MFNKIKNKFSQILNKVKKKITKVEQQSVKIGVPAGAAPYKDGTSTAVIAAVHEFGSITKNIPARPFLRPGFQNSMPKINKLVKIYGDTLDSQTLYEQIGITVESEVVKMWENNNWSPLKNKKNQKAVAKGERQILLDTGHLLNSITYQVKGGKKWKVFIDQQ